MLTSSVKQMTMSVVCIVMCLIVTTAFANNLPFTSAHYARNIVQSQLRPFTCTNTAHEEDYREGCTFEIYEYDFCRQWATCTRSSGDRWNERDLCKAAKWALFKGFSNRWGYRHLTNEQARVDAFVSVHDVNDEGETSSATFYNSLFAYAYNSAGKFLQFQNLTIESITIEVYLDNCNRSFGRE